MIRIVLVSIGVTVFVAGCLSPQARRGRAQVIRPGDDFSDFTFVDLEGTTRSFDELRGSFTVLMFTKCGGDQHRSVSAELADLVHGNLDAGYTETVGFDIHWSEHGCEHMNDCHLIDDDARMYSICDSRSTVRRAYGVGPENEIVIIGPDHKIALRDSVDNLKIVKSQLHQMFNEYAEFVTLTRSPPE